FIGSAGDTPSARRQTPAGSKRERREEPMTIPQLWKACAVLFALCAAPATASAYTAVCPGNAGMFRNLAGAASTFLVLVEFADPTAPFSVDLHWTSPTGIPMATTVTGNMILSVA